jgi:hypothetical protein
MPKMRQQETNHSILSLRRPQWQRRKHIVERLERIRWFRWLLRLYSTHLRLPLTAAG